MKHLTKQNITQCSLHGKLGNQMNNTVNTSKEKDKKKFFFKTFHHNNIDPPPNVYYMEFYRNFLIEYSKI